MAGLKHRPTAGLPGPDRPLWRSPVVLAALALSVLLIFVWVVLSEDSKPLDVPAPSVGSTSVNGDLQWPGLVGTAGGPVQPQPNAEKPEAPGRTFIARLNLQPRMRNGRVNGYIVRPDDAAILDGTLLRSGDVLLEVDGLELDPARAAQLAQNVGDYQDVYVRLERGNRQQEGLLSLGSR